MLTSLKKLKFLNIVLSGLRLGQFIKIIATNESSGLPKVNFGPKPNTPNDVHKKILNLEIFHNLIAFVVVSASKRLES